MDNISVASKSQRYTYILDFIGTKVYKGKIWHRRSRKFNRLISPEQIKIRGIAHVFMLEKRFEMPEAVDIYIPKILHVITSYVN